MNAAVHLTFLLCLHIANHNSACEATARATYQLNPGVYQPIIELDNKIRSSISPEFSLAFSVLSAYHNKQVYIQLINKEF